MTEKTLLKEWLTLFNLSEEEYQNICTQLGEAPNMLVLGIFSAMWSEHCSYKSSKALLKTLPSTGNAVVCGPGENAGVVDIGDGYVAVFKMESHNHPSFIEPHQGAATGVGGILRDVFTMGARPVALLNALRFGDVDHKLTPYLVDGVVSGISSYGNCIGIPTIGGETDFHAAYNDNILVNVMALGIARKDQLFYSSASGVGNLVIYIGAKTGRDGIHGASMASAGFSEDAMKKRPAVQIGDPFTGKKLMEASLELMQSGVVLAIQDMGAAGLTSSSVEMASKGKIGIELSLDAVPQREEEMTALELMLSESQERMLLIAKPEHSKKIASICAKWAIDMAIIGRLIERPNIVLKWGQEILADFPVTFLADSAPVYQRPQQRATPPDRFDASGIEDECPPLQRLCDLLSMPALASKSWIWNQYDSFIGGRTRKGSGDNAAIIDIPENGRALALTSDSTPRYCNADALEGGRQAVAEAWRNLTASGAKPLAFSDNLNFGNPENPKIMAQFADAVQGIKEAASALDFPVVSGNVSFYNESNGKSIMPTPVIAAVGIIDDPRVIVSGSFNCAEEDIFMIGDSEGWLGASLWQQYVQNHSHSLPPPVNLQAERNNGDFIRRMIEKKWVSCCRDLSGGGLLVAVGLMTIKNKIGASLNQPLMASETAWWFGEDQARYLVTSSNQNHLKNQAEKAGIPITHIGKTGGNSLTYKHHNLSLTEIEYGFQSWMHNYMLGA